MITLVDLLRPDCEVISMDTMLSDELGREEHIFAVSSSISCIGVDFGMPHLLSGANLSTLFREGLVMRKYVRGILSCAHLTIRFLPKPCPFLLGLLTNSR